MRAFQLTPIISVYVSRLQNFSHKQTRRIMASANGDIVRTTLGLGTYNAAGKADVVS